MTPWLSIVGVGADGIAALPGPARTLIDNAEVLIGGDRHLAMVAASHPAQRHGRPSENPFLYLRSGRQV